MPQKLKISKGQVFNSLTIISENFGKSSGRPDKRYFNCKCVCGKVVYARIDALRSNYKSSCGCQPSVKIQKTVFDRTTHGISKERLYRIYNSAKGRCYNVNNHKYPNYGGRGIRMCVEWKEDVSKFYRWAIENGYNENLQIDRRNNDRGYSPGNCRWVTRKVNMNNRSVTPKYKYKGQFLTLTQISEKTGIKMDTLYARVFRDKLPLRKAISIPVNVHVKSELTVAQRLEIYQSPIRSLKKLADVYNVKVHIINNIRRGKMPSV